MDIRFYDNEYRWKKDMNVHREIGFIHVDDTTPNIHIQHINTGRTSKNRAYNLEYIRHFAKQHNTYAQALLRAPILDNVYPTNGMDKHLESLKYWGTSNTKHKILLLDWDRTITAVENIYTPALDNPAVSFDDMFDFIMGGRDRRNKYTQLFHTLRGEYGLPIYIVTDNPNARADSKYRSVYLKMVNHLFGENIHVVLDEDNLIVCSDEYNNKKHLAVCATPLKYYLQRCKSTPVVSRRKTTRSRRSISRKTKKYVSKQKI